MRRLANLFAPLVAVLHRQAPHRRVSRADAVALLERSGGDVIRATRWCNAEMRRAEADREPERAREALALRRACGEIWAERIGARVAAS